MKSFFVFLIVIFSAFSYSHQQTYNDWKTVGSAKLKVLFWDIYTAELLTPDGRYSNLEQPLKLKLTYWRDIDRQVLTDETRNQWQKLGLYDQSDESWLTEINQLFPNIRKGEELTLVRLEDQQVLLLHQGIELARLENSQQVNDFFAIWLSENSNYPKLTKKLTGN
ncbi:hypothetical protein [Paraferrimonas sp. SM1919]|uniref:hypothetical protein n=1 Tax=Paraferrimonas sp. SM1919 TaxID=2662263 RepID=UPI0013D6D16D|nr:hypothetical protein [Paraferrimonas sp. SM1919]